MTQEEQIRLYRLMEKLNWFFHQEMHYLDKDIAEKTARECYPEIREFTYDILWNDLPKEVQDDLLDRLRPPLRFLGLGRADRRRVFFEYFVFIPSLPLCG